MSRLDLSDIQGNVVRPYKFPFAYYVFLRIDDPAQGRKFIRAVVPEITTAQWWEGAKPESTLNVAFTSGGLFALKIPASTMRSFPVDFLLGMRDRADMLGDDGPSAPEHWDEPWNSRYDQVHVWMSIHGQTPEARARRYDWLKEKVAAIGGVELIATQEAAALIIDGKPANREHFGYVDGVGDPAFAGTGIDPLPGRGKLALDGKSWLPLATGEFLLGHDDESGEYPEAPLPQVFARNGTFMVYRKLHQNVASFRRYLDEQAAKYPAAQARGKEYARELLAAKLVGRWRDGTPIELSADKPDPELAADPHRNNDFAYRDGDDGTRCPLGAHIRRMNPRAMLGFNGALTNRRRIIRRGLPYGQWTPEDQPADDDGEHGIIFMSINTSIFRQFEFVQQEWVNYGNDFAQGGEKDAIVGNHDGTGRVMIQGTLDPANPPFMCARMPRFVVTKGGNYFFLPSLAALRLMAANAVDPR